MNLHQIRSFCAIVAEGSFSRAAESQHLTQPTISAQMQALERALGSRLLDRSAQGVRLTQAGRAFHAYALQILELVDRAQSELDALKGLARGVLDVAASTVPGHYLLPSALAQFRQRYPGVQVRLSLANSQEVRLGIHDGRHEVGLVGEQVRDDRLTYTPLTTDQLVAIVRPDHPLGGRLRLVARDLLGEPLVVREPGSATRATLERALGAAGFDPGDLQIMLELGSAEAVKLAVRSTPALAVVSEWSVRDEVRNGKRTYHYQRKVEPRVCGRALLEAFAQEIDVVINRVVVYDLVVAQRQWLVESHQDWGVRNLVLVGGESHDVTYPGPSVNEATRLITQELNPQWRADQQYLCGGIAIATRRHREPRYDEPQRMLAKMAAGIEFFSTQVLYESESICQLLRDYAQACAEQKLTPRRIFLSFAPVGHVRHLEFMKWLGVKVSAKTEAALQDSSDVGEGSLQICEEVFTEILEFRQRQGLEVPLGLNVGPLVAGNFALSLDLVQRLTHQVRVCQAACAP